MKRCSPPISPVTHRPRKRAKSPETLIPKSSLDRPISPPPLRRSSTKKPQTADPSQNEDIGDSVNDNPTTSAVEAGKARIQDHLTFFSTKVREHTRPADAIPPRTPLISHGEWVDLYVRSQHARGRHFVIHQHDHPVAGTHYDLRLQISETSSVSWAIMYGLPGDPNSRRLNRNATETRVHCLWNHLIETASHKTGSILIWDTGEYEILPKKELNETQDTSGSAEDSDGSETTGAQLSESEKLEQAFRNRKIHLRLHGSRLPRNYTIYMRLTRDNNKTAQPKMASRRRQRHDLNRISSSAGRTPPDLSSSSRDSDSEPTNTAPPTNSTSARPSGSKPLPSRPPSGEHSDDDEDENIRRTNAYPGATNSTGSIHQRKWYLSLDRVNSGFVPVVPPDRDSSRSKRTVWMMMKDDGEYDGNDGGKGEKSSPGGSSPSYPFYVKGRDTERSVVTGRLGSEVLEDEGVVGFVPRGLWRPILE